MGVFSRTMLMLTMAWLVGLIVLFLYMEQSAESGWRDKFIAEANIRRAIAYRTVDIQGGLVAERGHGRGQDVTNEGLTAESIGAGPWDAGSAGSADPLPGSRVRPEDSLIAVERRLGQTQDQNFSSAKSQIEADITALRGQIADLQRERRTQDARLAEVRESSRIFAAQMQSYRYIIASFQQKIFNVDYEIQRVMIERDALIAELAQIRNDIRRIEGQQRVLEDSYYELSKHFDRNIKILAWYEQTDPNLRRMADATGRGWLRGRVVAVGDSPLTGDVSISIGRNEGVFVGQTFTIFRNDQFVARMVIDSVRPNVALGRLQEEFRGRVFVAEGDQVKTAESFGGAALRNTR